MARTVSAASIILNLLTRRHVCLKYTSSTLNNTPRPENTTKLNRHAQMEFGCDF